jgi:hypothetical protein
VHCLGPTALHFREFIFAKGHELPHRADVFLP